MIVSNFDCSEEILVQRLSGFGKILLCEFEKNKKGEAIVQFYRFDAMENVFRKNARVGIDINGKQLKMVVASHNLV